MADGGSIHVMLNCCLGVVKKTVKFLGAPGGAGNISECIMRNVGTTIMATF